mmetsp:Transcript_24087/g.52156  ORF Transcript_24087/g.52156 Transcript_24087/m.52156 type:complete len:419 (-) Transcript_24087:37-1293(-)
MLPMPCVGGTSVSAAHIMNLNSRSSNDSAPNQREAGGTTSTIHSTCHTSADSAADGNFDTIGRAPSFPDDGDLGPRSGSHENEACSDGGDGGGSSRDDNSGVIMITGSSFSDVNKKYCIEPDDIGCGNYGIIRRCSHRLTGDTYAIKSIPKSKEECRARRVKNVSTIESIKREAAILKQVHHPGIVRLVETYEDAKYLHLVTEMCSGGMLFDRIIAKDKKPFTEREAATMVKSILEAVAYLHDELNVVHRDIKCENFLFKRSPDDCLSMKLIDFGMSRECHENVMKTSIGTVYYIAPEVLSKSYGKKCDLWSVGVVAYMIICGYYPFYGDSTAKIIRHVKSGNFDFPAKEWGKVSSSAKDFISSLLTVDPNVRPAAVAAMEHPWIVKQTAEKKSLSRRVSRGLKLSMSSRLGSRSKTV